MSWNALLALAAGAYVLKAVGPVVVGNRQLPADVTQALELLSVPLVAALVAVQTLDGGGDSQLPSLDLPTDANIDEFIASFERRDRTADAPPVAATEMPEIDLRYAVDIAPGEGIEDLVVGSAAAPEPAAHDLHGLALTPTEPTAPPPAPVASLPTD